MQHIKQQHVNRRLTKWNPQQCETIVALARHHAQTLGDKQFILWLDKGTIESRSYTFAELDIRARSLAVQLTQIGDLNHKSTWLDLNHPAALIVTQPGLEFVIAFFACLYAGIAAVPAYPLKKNESTSRLQIMIKDSDAKILITDQTSVESIKSCQDINTRVEVISANHVDTLLCQFWTFPNINAKSTAFIQYTSGSTGAPKGVVITHGNLMYNERIIAQSMNHDSDTVIVGWLPLFHDMGLIGNLLHPLFLGVQCILMSPLSFVVNPIRWLEAISKYRATTSGGPNFAYDLCVSRTTAKQREQLDLSCWKIAYNGAEPIRVDSLVRFSHTFSKYGFKKSAMYPCYGMAESTLFVTGSRYNKIPTILSVDKQSLMSHKVHPVSENIKLPTSDPTVFSKNKNSPANHANQSDIIQLVSSGLTYQDCQVKIVDPATKVELDEDKVGEIWTTSPSIAQQYKNQAQLSQSTFHAQLSGTDSKIPFLRTGDLGFLHNNELFVTGRCKDLIIINGKNHYPQDIELTTTTAHPKIMSCTAAAFSVDIESREKLIVILSIKKNLLGNFPTKAISSAIKSAITCHHAIQIYRLAMVTSQIPITSSGKIQRSRCQQLYLNGELKIINSFQQDATNEENNHETKSNNI